MSAENTPEHDGPELIQNDTEPKSGIGRRAVLQSLLTGVGAGVALPALADAHPMQQHLANQKTVATAEKKAAAPAYKPEFLEQHQYATLEAIAERIVPGSTKARVAPFVDQLLAVDTHHEPAQLPRRHGRVRDAGDRQVLEAVEGAHDRAAGRAADSRVDCRVWPEGQVAGDPRGRSAARRREGDHLTTTSPICAAGFPAPTTRRRSGCASSGGRARCSSRSCPAAIIRTGTGRN